MVPTKLTTRPRDSSQTPAGGNVAVSQQPVHTPPGPASAGVHFGPRTFYDFSGMAPPSRPGGFLARRVTLHDDESLPELLDRPHPSDDSSDDESEAPSPNGSDDASLPGLIDRPHDDSSDDESDAPSPPVARKQPPQDPPTEVPPNV